MGKIVINRRTCPHPLLKLEDLCLQPSSALFQQVNETTQIVTNTYLGHIRVQRSGLRACHQWFVVRTLYIFGHVGRPICFLSQQCVWRHVSDSFGGGDLQSLTLVWKSKQVSRSIFAVSMQVLHYVYNNSYSSCFSSSTYFSNEFLLHSHSSCLISYSDRLTWRSPAYFLSSLSPPPQLPRLSYLREMIPPPPGLLLSLSVRKVAVILLQEIKRGWNIYRLDSPVVAPPSSLIPLFQSHPVMEA